MSQEVPTREQEARTRMREHNLIIIRDDGKAINSTDYSEYALRLVGMPDPEEGPPVIIKFVALKEPTAPQRREQVIISTFYELEEATNALASLISDLENKEQSFDVRDFNSNV